MILGLDISIIAFLCGVIGVLFYLYIGERNLNKLILANYKADLEVVTTTLDMARTQLADFRKAVEKVGDQQEKNQQSQNVITDDMYG